MKISKNLEGMLEVELNFLDKVISEDRSWCTSRSQGKTTKYEMICQNFLRQEKALRSRSRAKTFICKDVLEQLRERVRRDIVDVWVLCHDNTPATLCFHFQDSHTSSLHLRSNSVRFLSIPKVEFR